MDSNDLPLRTIEQIFRNMDLESSFPINNVSHELIQSIRSSPDVLRNLMRQRKEVTYKIF